MLTRHDSSKHHGDVFLIIVMYLAKICALLCGVKYNEEIWNSTGVNKIILIFYDARNLNVIDLIGAVCQIC